MFVTEDVAARRTHRAHHANTNDDALHSDRRLGEQRRLIISARAIRVDPANDTRVNTNKRTVCRAQR